VCEALDYSHDGDAAAENGDTSFELFGEMKARVSEIHRDPQAK